MSELVSDFQVIPSTAEEIKTHPEGPIALISENAKIKAGEVARRISKGLGLGGRHSVFLEENHSVNPGIWEQATKMLLALSGKHMFTVATGVCLTNIFLNKEIIFSGESFVTFKKLSEEMIESYFQVVDPLDKAGAYAIQTNLEMIIERSEGSLSNVIGLPVEKLRQELKHLKLVR